MCHDHTQMEVRDKDFKENKVILSLQCVIVIMMDCMVDKDFKENKDSLLLKDTNNLS